MKKILILGGTNFIGRNLVEALEQKGDYDITLFNRQQTHADLFPQLKKIKGDRETNDVQQLSATDWDTVIDISCYYPDNLESLLNTLKAHCRRYVFISTISVYQLDDASMKEIITEDLQIQPYDETHTADRSMATYGQRKAECERILNRAAWLDKIILRPAVVYGKYDHTDRFYYWLYKAEKHMPLILPDNGSDLITLTYVKDLTDIIIRSIEIEKHSTVYNATTHLPFSLKEMLQLIKNDAESVSIPAKILLEKGIMPEKDIPLWFNASLEISNYKLTSDYGFISTSFAQSVEESRQYFETLGWPLPKAGMSIEAENKLLH